MNVPRLAICVLLTVAALMSGCHTPGGGPLRCKCFDHLPRDRKWILHKYFDPHRYDYHTTCWNQMMYDPCACCWNQGLPGEMMMEGTPNGMGEIIDAPAPDETDPMLDPVPPPLPPLDSDPLPSFDPVPGEEGLVPDLGESSGNRVRPLIQRVTFQAPSREGAPVLMRIPHAD